MPQDTQVPETIADREAAIIDEFSLFDDWMNRYAYLIELGDAIPLIENEYRTEAYKIHGCQSQVWIRADSDGERVRFHGDSDAKITKGLAALIIRVLDGQPADAIADANLGFLEEIDLKQHLSSQRQNGLQAMVKQMKVKAMAHEAVPSEEVSPRT